MEMHTLPSGRDYFNLEDLTLLKRLHDIGTIEWADKPYTLKSGIPSRVYIHGRNEITEDPSVLKLIGAKIATRAEKVRSGGRPLCLIGIPTAGTPLAAAASIYWGGMGFRQMRQILKDHGASHGWTDSPPNPDVEYMTTENVMTTGRSIWENLERLATDGYPMKKMHHIVLIDRQQGGLRKLAERGYEHVEVIYNLLDIAYAFKVMGLWSEERYVSIVDEIQAHQAA